VPAKRTTASKTKTERKPTKKATPKASAPKSITTAMRAQKAAPRTTPRKATTGTSRRSATPARRGDIIVIDSAQVGSPRREGEVLRVIHGEVSVSYQVRWGDGHETLISPGAGTAHIVRK
jgi:hypothetical protein